MSYENSLNAATQALRQAQVLIDDEMRRYPTPVSGCDAQYNHLISQRSAIAEALQALGMLPFVATPRTPDAGAGIESR